MFEQSFLSSEIKSDYHCEELLLARNRIPFLNTGVLFLAGYGESSFLPGTDRKNLYQPYWSFQLITNGLLEVTLEGKGVYHLKKGDFFITRPGHSYKFKTIGNDILAKRYIMVSHGVLVTLLCEQGLLADQTVLQGTDPLYVSEVFDSIRDLALSGGEDMQKKLSGMTYDFLLHLLPEEKQVELPGGLSRIIEDIHANIADHFTLKSMAQKYGIGDRTLNRLFIKYMNCPPIQYVIRTRMMYAKQLLRSEGLGIENIARVCGYKSFAFFSKEFRRMYGLTPEEYRKEEIISEKKVTEFFQSHPQTPLLKTPLHQKLNALQFELDKKKKTRKKKTRKRKKKTILKVKAEKNGKEKK